MGSSNTAHGADVAVIGGGMVGTALAYGMARHGADVAVLDEGDVAHRAARGNFGLVWSQSKGLGMPAYVAWTRASVDDWPDFAREMGECAGVDLGYHGAGGLILCLGEKELEERANHVRRLHNQSGGMTQTRMLDRREVAELLPRARLGARVLGASYAPRDGHVSPLLLLRALHAGLRRHGGRHLLGATVTQIVPDPQGFAIERADGTVFRANRVVIAAGIATTPLARQVGIDLPVRPQRGQNIVTERLAPMLDLPLSALRQTDEGVIQIGVSNEEVGVNPGTTLPELARMAARAIEVLPALAQARLVRAWGALRPLTPDGFPAYAQSEAHPGAFAVSCHSGVTLAAQHARVLARAILAGRLPDECAAFHPRRFDVRTAA
jgi:glycine/D-amino acid oxidase-like deaminating enzyme